MKYRIEEIKSVRISKKGLYYVDVDMIVSEFDVENPPLIEKTKTFTRKEYEEVKNNGYFED